MMHFLFIFFVHTYKKSANNASRNCCCFNNDAVVVCWDAKSLYFSPRPSQMNPDIKTVTGIPNFPAYVSGHSTFSGAAATVLGYIIPANASKYKSFADEASKSRLYAAIHYRSDCDKGLEAGNKVGTYAIARGHNDGAE